MSITWMSAVFAQELPVGRQALGCCDAFPWFWLLHAAHISVNNNESVNMHIQAHAGAQESRFREMFSRSPFLLRFNRQGMTMTQIEENVQTCHKGIEIVNRS